ncbi:hypothetical protein D9M72_654870 [compost metagenome]
MQRLDQPARLQLGQRLAHHGAAHAVGLHDGRLGRQLVAGAQRLAADLLAQVFHQPVRQAARALARPPDEGGVARRVVSGRCLNFGITRSR